MTREEAEITMGAMLEMYKKTSGASVEIGTANGTSAKMWVKEYGVRTPYLCFDTFGGGHPKCKLAEDEGSLASIRMYNCEKETYAFLEEFGAVPIKGIFPEETVDKLPKAIAFAYLDADNYMTTKQALEIIGERLEANGIIVLHDYYNKTAPGIKKAVDEFLQLRKRFSFAALDDNKNTSPREYVVLWKP